MTITQSRAFAACWLTVAAAVTCGARAGAQQLDYSNTALIHGFGSRAAMWTTPRAALGSVSTQEYLAQRVDLANVWRPNWDSAKVFDVQWQNVRDSIASHGGGHVLVGHSIGGLVSRYAYLNGGQGTQNQVRAILAVASPHQGAILADSAMQLGAFAHDLKRKIDNATPHVKYSLAVIVSAFVSGFLGVGAGAAAFMAVLFMNFPSATDASQLLTVGTLPALRTTSPQVSTLNNSGPFDAGIPRANIVARLDNNKFMALKLAAAFRGITEQAQISEFQKARSVFNGCKNILGFTIIGIPSAIACSDAERMMGRLDETWARYSNGSSRVQVCGQVWDPTGPHQRCWYEQRPRLDLPTDGVVPNERSRFPSEAAGEFHQEAPVTANHMTVYRVPDGAQAIARAMLALRMRPAPPPPPPGASATITGTSSIHPGTGCSWGVSVTGGAAPYSYQWFVNGEPAGDGSESLNYTNNGSAFTIEVIATDQNGAGIPGSLYVSIVSGHYCT